MTDMRAIDSRDSQENANYIAVIDANTEAQDGLLTLPMTESLLSADFERMGRDLVIHQNMDDALLIANYFSNNTPPALQTSHGKRIHSDLVERLAGPVAPMQYAGPASQSEAIGTVDRLDGLVKVRRADGSEETLNAGDPVYQDDVIETDDSGMIGIEFADGSIFTLGNDARMTLDSLVYDPLTGEGESSISVMKGMFRFVSGDIAANNPGDMEVRTPVATLGIRGTTGGGQVMGENQDNHFFLEPNADGTVGWIDVKTDAGIQSLNQPNLMVEIHSYDQAPPPPAYVPPADLANQYGGIMDFASDGKYSDRIVEEMRQMQSGEEAPAPAQENAEPEADTAPVDAQPVQEQPVNEATPEEEALLDAEAVKEETKLLPESLLGRDIETSGFEDTATTKADALDATHKAKQETQPQADSTDAQVKPVVARDLFFSDLLNRLAGEDAKDSSKLSLNEADNRFDRLHAFNDARSGDKVAVKAAEDKLHGDVPPASTEIEQSALPTIPLENTEEDNTADSGADTPIPPTGPTLSGLPSNGIFLAENGFDATGYINLLQGITLGGHIALQTGQNISISIAGAIESGLYLGLDVGGSMLGLNADSITLEYNDGTNIIQIGTLGTTMNSGTTSLDITLSHDIGAQELWSVLNAVQLHFDEHAPQGNLLTMQISIGSLMYEEFDFRIFDDPDAITLTSNSFEVIDTGDSNDDFIVANSPDLAMTDNINMGDGLDFMHITTPGTFNTSQFSNVYGLDVIRVDNGVGAVSINVSQQMIDNSDYGLLTIEAEDNSIAVDASGVSSGGLVVGSNMGGQVVLSNTAGNPVHTSDFNDQNNIIGSGDDDVIFGNNAMDNLDGAGGNDVLYGGFGSDTLRGGSEDDILHGEEGNDMIIMDEWNNNDIHDGGQGFDKLHVDASFAPATINFSLINGAGATVTNMEVFDISADTDLSLVAVTPNALELMTDNSNTLTIHSSDTNSNSLTGTGWTLQTSGQDLYSDGNSYSTYTGTGGSGTVTLHVDESINTITL